jgi:[ribosomal protein S5]-alanine N-acetyltransferase
LSNTYFLQTARLGFRQWATEDWALALQLWGDPEVTRLTGGPFPGEKIRARFETELANGAAYGVQYWPMFLLADGDFVGCCGLRPYKLDEQIYEIGYHLRPVHWRRGIAEEAARAVAVFAFETIGASALFAGHHPQNEGSRRVLQKLGFCYTHDRLYPPTGLMHPAYLLTKPDQAESGN